MENLKIEAENLDQKNEIINLFISLGCKKDSFCTYNNDNLMGIHFYRDGYIQDVLDEDYNHGEHKEITLPELRDLVVLKRNDVGDATHSVDGESGSAVILNGVWYGYNFRDGIWDLWVDDEEYKLRDLKPIEKKEMKEYLVKSQDGKWRLETDLVGDPADTVIEVPCGADYMTMPNMYFWRDHGESWAYSNIHKNWNNNKGQTLDQYLGEGFANIVWQRNPEPKQAEFLVKTDSGYVLQVLDENAGGEAVVRVPDGAEIAILASGVIYFWKSHFFNGGVNKDWVDMKGGWDASWYLKSVPSAITIWQRETPNDQVEYLQAEELPFVDDESINDQYAEIEKVRQNSKLDQSISDFKNTDRGKEFDAFDLIEDTVNHPSHYAGEIECIDAMEAMLTPEQFIGYLRGNSFKYMWRYENKGGITDLEKAQWYLNKLISRIC